MVPDSLDLSFELNPNRDRKHAIYKSFKVPQSATDELKANDVYDTTAAGFPLLN